MPAHVGNPTEIRGPLASSGGKLNQIAVPAQLPFPFCLIMQRALAYQGFARIWLFYSEILKTWTFTGKTTFAIPARALYKNNDALAVVAAGAQ